jgi:hypothetical protein
MASASLDSNEFYGEYHGHRVPHLELVLREVQSSAARQGVRIQSVHILSKNTNPWQPPRER